MIGEPTAHEPPRPRDQRPHRGIGEEVYGALVVGLSAAVHVGQLLQPVPGGIGRYVAGLVDALPGAGVEPVLFAAGPRPPGVPSSLPYVDLGPPRGSVRYAIWHRFRRPPVPAAGEVVHATSLAVPPAHRRALVVTVHDLVFLRHPEHLTSRGVDFHRRGLAIAKAEAEAIVVPTAWGRDDLVAEGFEPDRVHVAPHGVEARLGGTPLEDPGVPSPYLLFVGTVEPRKGIADVVAAHRALQASCAQLRLVIAGAPGWGPSPDLDGEGIVTLRPDDRQLDALYRSAVALALPSRYEGFGLPVVEAMARGCPVVTSTASCLPEVAGGAASLVAPGDVDGLAGAFERLLVDQDHRRQRIAAGQARAAAFTWAASAEAHAGAYAAALAAVSP